MHEGALAVNALLHIRAERDRMSAIERRIADFVLDNAQLLRDYSSQQLANALGISQSSVVKFCQKLGFKGYPDLKYSIGEAIARHDNGDPNGAPADGGDPAVDPSGDLWRSKTAAFEETGAINGLEELAAVADAIEAVDGSGKVFLIGLGEDDIHARGLALRLSMLGILAVHNFDPAHMAASVSAATPGDVLVLFSEHGRPAALCHLARLFRERGGTVVTVTRHTSNPLRAHADLALVVAAHDERPHVEPLLYRSAVQHLMDRIYLRLCTGAREARLLQNLEHLQPMIDP